MQDHARPLWVESKPRLKVWRPRGKEIYPGCYFPNEAHLAPFRFVSKHPSHSETSQAMTYHSQTQTNRVHNFINVHNVSALGWTYNLHGLCGVSGSILARNTLRRCWCCTHRQGQPNGSTIELRLAQNAVRFKAPSKLQLLSQDCSIIMYYKSTA